MATITPPVTITVEQASSMMLDARNFHGDMQPNGPGTTVYTYDRAGNPLMVLPDGAIVADVHARPEARR